ncbi:MAG: TetR/AcrR family transcriptional regulator [Phycisphaerae bacterium]|nr:TetR/AcrR family transcriptional regulator [Phycisphaerae bacterium]
MPIPRFEKLDAESRATILDAARVEFAAHGYDGSSYNRIIANSGRSKSSFYYYFQGKQDLYVTVVKDAVAQFTEAVGQERPVEGIEEFWAECARMFLRFYEFGMNNPVLVGVLKSVFELQRQPLGGDLLPQLALKDVTWYETTIQRGQGLGAIRADYPIDLIVALLFAVLEAKMRWSLERWFSSEAIDIKQDVDFIIDLFRRMAAPADPETGKPRW